MPITISGTVHFDSSVSTTTAAVRASGTGTSPAPVPSGTGGSGSNTPGGADPWGGLWPGPGNTGVPSGTVLTAYTGGATITVDNTVIDSKLITDCLNIAANNVTIRNSLIQSNGCYYNVLNNSGGTGLQLIDCEIDSLGNILSNTVAGNNYTCLRCNLHGGGDIAKGGTNVTFQDSYIHDLVVDTGSHSDGIQTLESTAQTIQHCTIIVLGLASSAITLSTGAGTAMRNIVINRNLVAGGGYCIYGGFNAAQDDILKVSNISVTENRVSTVVFPLGGSDGPMTSVDPPVVHNSNVWADGPNAGVAID